MRLMQKAIYEQELQQRSRIDKGALTLRQWPFLFLEMFGASALIYKIHTPLQGHMATPLLQSGEVELSTVQWLLQASQLLGCSHRQPASSDPLLVRPQM